MDYNSQRERLVLPEYGRLVQEMVNYAIEEKNREKRQKMAEVIVGVMGSFNPQMRNVPEFRHKLWDHLAAIADYKLDIDYPVEITREERALKPEPLPYPSEKIRMRHYGALVQQLLDKIPSVEDKARRDALIKLTAERMKVNLVEARGVEVEDAKIADDIALYTDGSVRLDVNAIPLSKVKPHLGEQFKNSKKRKKNKF